MVSDLPHNDPHYHGFSLRSVTWGYREIFAEAIDELFEAGKLGPQQQEVTRTFFSMLKQADQSGFDHVLRQFLGALNPRNRWIMDLPGLFGEVVQFGCSLAASKLYYGSRFFETLARGGLGGSPQQIRDCLRWARELCQLDEELAMAFLDGYAWLTDRLQPAELQRYLDVALEIYHGHAENARAFLRGELASSEAYVLTITQECRLVDAAERLDAMLQALTGQAWEMDDLSGLDSDDVIERGTQTQTLAGFVYLPVRVRRFETAAENRRWYLLCGLCSAAMTLERSFPLVHGHPEYPTCRSLAGDAAGRINLFMVVETARVLRAARRRWPGGRRLIDWGIKAEFTGKPLRCEDRLLLAALDESVDAPELRRLREVADACVNCFETARRLDEPWAAEVLAAWPNAQHEPMRPVGFLSDFLFPVEFSEAATDQQIADLKQEARRRTAGQDDADGDAAATPAEAGEQQGDGEDSDAPTAACIYDEWDIAQNDYRRDWCHVHVRRPEPVSPQPPRGEWLDQARKVRAVFERLKPDLARREKHLADGDAINVDLLLSHLVDRRREPSPPIRFYEKPLINHRDLAVLILLDVSGSTGEHAGGPAKVLDVEKQAAMILGEGLAALDDRFAICGFSSAGREQCEFLMLKDFADPWTAESIGRVMAVSPRHSTRIGPALRHAGWLLGRQPSRQRLIILVTDGKPMDDGYDPNSGYAQHDVRMACEENARQDIHTVGISTAEHSKNTLADMEVMFPHRRFVILPSIQQLPRVLPQLYLRLTL